MIELLPFDCFESQHPRKSYLLIRLIACMGSELYNMGVTVLALS